LLSSFSEDKYLNSLPLLLVVTLPDTMVCPF